MNELLREHFDEYKAKIIDAVYYPLKTMDSVPRFKHPILTILNAWNADDAILNLLLTQGLSRRMFEGEQQGREQIGRMINYIADTYEGIEEMLDEIDRKHNEYTNASIDHIRYLMNSDRGVKGKLIELMKHAHSDAVMEAMQQSIRAGQYLYVDMKSLYTQAKRSVREEGKPLAVSEKKEDPALVAGFLEEVRRRYTNPKIDAYVEACFGGREMFLTEEAKMEDSEDFILFLLGTLRGQEKSAGYTVEFLEGNREVNGCSLPGAVFRRKP